MAIHATGVGWGFEVSSSGETPDVPCLIARSPREPWKKARLGLRRPEDTVFSVWELMLAVTIDANEDAQSAKEETWRVGSFCYVKRFSAAARDAGACCLPWLAELPMPALTGFEVNSTHLGLLLVAAPSSDKDAVGRLCQLHAWVCHALEDLSNETELHSCTPHYWTSGISVEWPVGSKQDALKHLAAMHYHIDLVAVREVLKSCEFAGTECPICLEPWIQMPQDAPAVALPCGHGCCEGCLDRLGVFAGARLDCPVCRLPASRARTWTHVKA
eukprot:TRINITY_DN123277_c0_g1_i1.p1 TRINITY_DN123277_c0_g1~~TRINITY_DN123277_c0_g1_i1.p1  ORF type:complete len:273 (-),score=33.82 TRINITY_DN123277_c0_g1_i1:53-871(-)